MSTDKTPMIWKVRRIAMVMNNEPQIHNNDLVEYVEHRAYLELQERLKELEKTSPSGRMALMIGALKEKLQAAETREAELRKFRLHYAGAIGLLSNLSVELEEDSVDNVERAISDFCRLTGYTYQRVLSRIDLYPPERGSNDT